MIFPLQKDVERHLAELANFGDGATRSGYEKNGVPGSRSSISLDQGALATEEKLHYHSVSNSEKQLARSGAPPLFYASATFSEHYDAVPISSDNNAVRLARLMPPDGRIQLPFDMHWLVQIAEYDWTIRGILSDRPINDKDACKDHIRNRLRAKIESLASFFQEEFKTFGCFVVRDIDPWKRDGVLYDIGCHRPYVIETTGPAFEARIAKERLEGESEVSDWLAHQKLFCQIDEPHGEIAPWQRIILCQGLSLASERVHRRVSFPFIVFSVTSDPIRMATDLHLSCDRRGGSETTNPYSNLQNAFHIIFYERLEMLSYSGIIKASKSRGLKIGHLHDKPDVAGEKTDDDELAFRRSSFTMLATARSTQKETESQSQSQSSLNSEMYWTMLILSPSGFFPQPTAENLETDWKIDVGKASRQTAELSCIVYALREIEGRWRQFNEHIGSLLVEDFMDPKAYSRLLFDDETFSRSRLYFWILGCLNEFNVAIEDNIKQWTLYRRARVHHLLDLSGESQLLASIVSSPKPSALKFDSAQDLTRLRELDKEAGEIRQGLEDLRAEFKAKQVTVQALRDGLFNASALMESRSSTRLGKNVQLLTYVSIFYLPLAFCAALWAIPNITDDKTRNPFIVTVVLVGFGTYAVVFNLGNISELLGRVYFKRREQLLREMEDDEDESWQTRRGQFDEFPPNQERNTPSEWWMIRYQMRRLFRKRKPEPLDF